MIEKKLAVYALILIFVPPVCWCLTDKARRILRNVLVVSWLLGLFLGYPIITFAWAVSKIDQHYDHNCAEVLRLSKYYGKIPYVSLQSGLIAKLTGRTPEYYYLSSMAHCEVKMGNIKKGLRLYEDLRNYIATSDYDRAGLPLIDRVVERLRSRLQTGDKKAE